MNKKMTFVLLATFLSLVSLLNFPIPALFITMLLGLLFIPPALLFVSLFIKGVQAIAKELGDALESGKEMFIVSVSKESIILEPNINR
ncbi:MAG: hypothetical protein PHU34_09135 [Candidatus Methanoperedens sp.]|nr:hypothetical protein [Candidatus Methanoperedens sp.]